MFGYYNTFYIILIYWLYSNNVVLGLYSASWRSKAYDLQV